VSDLEVRVAMLERMVSRLMRTKGTSVSFGRSTTPPIDTGRVQTVQAQMDALSLRDNIPVLFHYGYSAAMPVDGDKIIAYLNDDRSSGVVIATGHQTYRLTGLATGEVALYDMWGRSIKLGAGGIVMNANNQPLQINNCTTMTVQATRLQCTGDIIDNYQGNANTAANMRSIYNNHTHGGVQGGSSHTAHPDQPMVI
jgi:phage gp45-like